MRAAGKTVNFGILYGQGAYGLSQLLEVTPEEAQHYIDNYFVRFAGVKAYKERELKKIVAEQRVHTLFGRVRHFPDLASQNKSIRAAAERMAFNTLFQGTAADIIKRAMVAIDRRLRAEGWRARMLIQVHDELVFEAPEAELERFLPMVKQEMEGAAQLKVPLIVTVGTGANWGEAH